MCDVDCLPCPDAIDVRANPRAAIEFVRSKLPEPFRNVTTAYQWSGSMGLGKNAWQVLKAHLWFWLKDPATDSDLATWLAALGPDCIIDKALANPVQIHYTSAPLLIHIEDPFSGVNGLVRNGLLDGEMDVVDLKPVLMKAVFTKAAKRPAPPRTARSGEPDPEPVPNDSIPGPASLSRATREFLSAGVAEGERNTRLFAAACDMAGSGFAREEAEHQLLEAASRCSPPMQEDEARRTIDSAYSAPREPAKPSRTAVPQSLVDVRDLSATQGTELWFACALDEKFCEQIRWVEPWRKWYRWNDNEGRWREDDTRSVWSDAQRFVLDDLAPFLAAEKARRENEKRRRKEEGENADAPSEDGEDPAKILFRFQQKTPLGNALELLKSRRGIAAEVSQWDCEPKLLCVGNGTIELDTGTLRESRRSDYLTKHTSVRFEPNAECQEFLKVLARVLPDPEVRDYFQRAIGYSATGVIREHVLHVLWGEGANGKTTVMEAVRYVLEDYAAVAPSSLLLEAKGERHPTEQALLFGKRFVVCSESPPNGRLNETLMKSLTGGDTITARRMREDFWSFQPTHKLFLSTNHRPRITGTDEGVWRRLRLIEFGVTIPLEERDPQLPEKLRAEAPGILRWVVEGARAYFERGLSAPAAVLAATEEYRSSEDTFGQFFEECLVRVPTAFLASATILETHQRWSADNGMARAHLTSKALAGRMRSLGFEPSNSGRKRGYLGLMVRPECPYGPPCPPFDGSLTDLDGSLTDPSVQSDPFQSGVTDAADGLTADSCIQDHTRAHARPRAQQGNPDLPSKRQDPSSDRATEGLDDDPVGPGDAVSSNDCVVRRGTGSEPCPWCRGSDFRRHHPGDPWICFKCHGSLVDETWERRGGADSDAARDPGRESNLDSDDGGAP